MEWFSTWTAWHWLILGFILLIAEIVIPGIFLLWWGIAALIVAGIMTLIPTFSLTILGIIYAILAFTLSFIWWKYQHGKDEKDHINSTLNRRAHSMLGMKGIVQEVNSNGIGRGYFGDTTWRIQGEELNVGDSIQVIDIDGITLFVHKLN